MALRTRPAAKFLWLYKAPPKVQFFMWLLIHGRIQCKTNLLRKRVVDNPICEVCNQMPESTDNIIAECEFATEVWLMLGIIFQNGNTGVASAIHETAAPSHIPDKHFPTFVVLCCWQLWKRRNGVVFRSQYDSMNQFLSACISEAKLWKHRLPKQDRQIVDSWCNIFQTAM
jgi:hypothetical protein